MEQERIEMGWKQFEGKKKYLVWVSVEASPDPPGGAETTAEDVQRERDTKDGEARRRSSARP